jgi:starvation-inducible DNA-binding protein
MSVIHSPLGNSQRDQVGTLLQATLVDLLGLADGLRQSSWVMVGAQSAPSRSLLRESRERLSASAEVLALRLAAIGVAPDGRTQTVADRTEFGAPEPGWLEVSDAVAGVIEGISFCVVHARERLDELSTVDAVSAHVLLGVIAGLESESWEWQSAGVNWISRGKHGS